MPPYWDGVDPHYLWFHLYECALELKGAGAERDDRGWDGWMASPTQWAWVWVSSRSWWWTGRPGVLRFMGSQRVGHDWMNWTELKVYLHPPPPVKTQVLLHSLGDVSRCGEISPDRRVPMRSAGQRPPCPPLSAHSVHSALLPSIQCHMCGICVAFCLWLHCVKRSPSICWSAILCP